ncbi:MAG: Cell division protein FtsX [Candidatus Pacebacteria bacterium GW2011_GWB1_47_8]|nr:MAG: Cell division protein FtsX [Candidatus Pacebacteria bacterium GW2011_GWB1_47_8]
MKKLLDALVAIRRTPYQSLVAILMVTVTFFVGYIFSLFVLGTNTILKFFETRPQVIAFFEIDTETQEVEALASAMREKSYVESVNVVTKEQALELYRQDHREDPLLLELVTADILPASVEVSGDTVDSLERIQTDLEGVQGVEDVVYQEDIVANIKQWTNAVRGIGAVAITILGLVSFLTIVTIMGMKISSRRHAISVMNVIGATRWYISGAFIIEGILYGLVGSLLGWSIMYALFLYATPWLENFMGSIIAFPLAWQVLLWQIGLGTLVAVLLGAGASLVATQRMMRKQ